MGILKTFTFKSLLKNRKRTIVTIVAIIITAAMLTGVATIAVSFQDLFIRQAINDYGNYHVKYENVPEEKVSYLKHHDLVQYSFSSALIGHSKINLKDEGKSTVQISGYDESGFKKQPIKLVEGALPKNSSQVVIEERLAKHINIKIGQKIDLDIGLRKFDDDNKEVIIADSKEYTYEVVGLIKRADFEVINYTDYIILTMIDDRLNNVVQQSVSLTYKSPKNAINKSIKIAEDTSLPKLGGIYSDYSFTFNKELLRWLGASIGEGFSRFTESAALIISILIVIGSFTVIYNSFNISINERKKQFGVLRSIGATKKQIRSSIYWEGILLSIIGIPLGIISGLIGIGITLKIADGLVQDIFNNAVSLNLVISPIAILFAIAFMVFTIFISVIMPAKKASRISPIEAIKLTTDIVNPKKIKTSKITRRLFGIEGEIALKNLKRNKKKYFATIISLFISIVLFVTFNSFMNYTTDVSSAYLEQDNYDLSIAFSTDDLYYKTQFVNSVKELEEVEEITKVRSFQLSTLIKKDRFSSYFNDNFFDLMNFKKEDDAYLLNVMVVSISDNYFDTYSKLVSQDNENIESVLVTRHVLQTDVLHSFDMLDVSIGDKLNIFSDDQEKSVDITIAKLADSSPLGVEVPNVMPILVVSEDTYSEIITQLNLEVSNSNDNYFIKTEKPYLLEEKIEEMHNISYGNLYLYNQHAHSRNNRKMALLISIFVYGFVILITLIGVTNIVNTISTNINLRRREFAMLKSVGLTRKGLHKILNYESFFYGFKSLAFGLPASIVSSYLLYLSFGFISSFEFVVPIKSLVISSIGVFVIVFLTMIYSTKRLKSENLIESI